MVLDLKKVFTQQNKIVPFDYSIDLSSTEVDSAHPFVSPVKVLGTIKGLEGFAELKAQVSFNFSIPCDRCTRQISRHFVYSFSHTLVRKLENEDDDQLIEVHDGKLDLDELMREDILLELPTKFLCREDCKGICPVCGKNLNDGPCGCGYQDDSAQLPVLKNLLQ
jgi:uncharacterized protein